MNKTEAIVKIERQLNALGNLSGGTDDPAFKKWRRGAGIALEHVFGKGTNQVTEFWQVAFRPLGIVLGGNQAAAEAHVFAKGKVGAKALLQSMIAEVEEYGLPTDEGPIAGAEPPANQSDRVFIVHGHNDAYKVSTARLIEQVGLKPIILHEQPSQGRTIIEKFEQYSDVGFAVVILSGDDKGGPADKDPDDYKRRARQNVILELGFFLAHLGRDRVCALYEAEVEIPSDYKGVVFVSLDDGGAWRFSLCQELRAAGLDADLNKVK